MTKVGIGFTGVPWSYQQTLELVKYADEKNFDTAWMAEDYFTRNAPAVLGAWAAETKKVKLATGILPIFTRHVALGAMTAATLDEISGGRAIFGLGYGLTQLMTVSMGFAKPPAIAAIREYCEAFKLIMKGENVNYDGSYVKCKNVKLGISPLRSKVPIYLAANQQRMLRLAGEVADGVLLTAGTTPEHVAYAYDRIAEGAKTAGRNKDDVKVTGFVFVAVSEDKNFNGFRDIPLMKVFPAYCLSGEYGELIAELSGYDKTKNRRNPRGAGGGRPQQGRFVRRRAHGQHHERHGNPGPGEVEAEGVRQGRGRQVRPHHLPDRWGPKARSRDRSLGLGQRLATFHPKAFVRAVDAPGVVGRRRST